MTPERWQQITGIFESALKRDPASRAAFVAAACTADDDLRQEVEAMLSSHERAGGFIESPAMEVVARQAGDGQSLLGQTIAHYQVLSLLGSGGMGDVYLALDTKLGRKVALKLLPEYLASDSHRARMFTKEARAASALNHPNIITIHEIGRLGERYYIAMEYIEGETLGEKIHRQRAPLIKLLKYLQQVAEGLTKAHAAGIVHRDLKPDNIMISGDGYAKILDFGLAKLVEQPERLGAAEPSEANTALMSPTSIPGMVMGTLGYMSPEQAQGKSDEIDHRSDIFSFGCILYEAATSQRAFEGKDVLDSLHKIVHAPTPSLLGISPQAPPDLERIVRRCLQKDPEKRYQSIKDVAIELEELRQETKGAVTQSAPLRASTAELTASPTSSAEYLVGEIKRHKRGVSIALGVALLMLAGLAFGLYKFWLRRVSTPAIKITRLTNNGNASEAAVSPDGKFIAYVVTEAGQQSIRLSLVDNPASATVIVPPGKMIAPGISRVNFSRDGKLVFYNLPYYEGTFVAGIESAIYQVPVLGGMTKKLADKVPAGTLLSSDGQHLAFARRLPDEIQLCVSDVGRANERVIATRKLPKVIFPAAWSPDGQTLACVSSFGDGSTTGNIVVVNVADGSEKPLTAARGWFFRSNMKWLPDGSGLIFGAREQQVGLDQLWHVSYPGGEVRRITTDLASYTGVSLSADAGMIVTTQIDQPLNIWVLPEGDSSRARPITSGRHFIGSLSWTTDNRIVYSSGDVTPKDISVVASDGSGQQILAAGSDSAGYLLPSVSPDGRYIVFASGGRAGRMDLNGANQRVLTTSGPFAQAPQVTPDGQWVIYSTNDQQTSRLYKVSINGGEPVQISDKLIWRPQVSPDGSQIACLYRETGNEPYKIAILPLAGGEPVKVFDYRSGFDILSGPARLLRWSFDGRALYYTDERDGISNIWRLPVDTNGPATQISNFTEGVIRSFAWSRDGKLLAVSRGVPSSDVVLITEFK